MSDIERSEDGRIKVTWTVIPASDEKHYLVPVSDADKLEAEFSTLRDHLEGAAAEIARLECALQQVRSRFHESDMRGVRETLDKALDAPTTGGQ